jgi:hypothetical protein
MIASRRKWHYRLWLVIAPLTLAGLVAAVALRRATPVQEPPIDSAGARP